MYRFGYEFETLAKQHHTGRSFRTASRRSQFVTVTEGKRHDVTVGRTLDFPKGSIVAIDKGYNDYEWYKKLTNKGIYFVTRLKSNAKYRVVCRRTVLKSKGLICDQSIEFTGLKTAKKCPVQLRRITYRDAETGKRYVFLTNNFKLAAKTIADIYKARWQVELFLKWVKQNLMALLRGDPPNDHQPNINQMALL